MSTATPTRRAAAHAGGLRLRVERRGERSVVTQVEGHVPYAARVAFGRPGWARVVLVQTIAGPLSGDRACIEVELGARARLELVANAATVALPAPEPARHELRFELDEGARLAWLPEPVILAAGCDLVSSLQLSLAGGAAALARDTVVLGRHGEEPGRYRATARCELDGSPLLHDTVEIAPGVAAHSGAQLAGARTWASLALLGIVPAAAPGPGELELAGPGRVLRALAPDAAVLRARVASVETSYLTALSRAAD